MYELIRPNTYFVYQRELEYIFAACEMIYEYGRNEEINQVYDRKAVCRRYRDLVEIMKSLNQQFWFGFLEGLLYVDLSKVTCDTYEQYLLSLPVLDFLELFFQYIPREELEQALQSEEQAVRFFEQREGIFSGYLAFRAFFFDTHRIIRQFFKMVRELKTDDADEFLKQRQDDIEKEHQELIAQLKEKEPFALTEEMLDKQCKNRGPYQTFYFMPAVFFPIAACRLFEKEELMFYSYDCMRHRTFNVSDKLKVLADPTRYRILTLIRRQPHLTGVEIAKQLNLAPSTVSHHMNTLRDAGLIHEEPAGSTKCYSLAAKMMENCIKQLQETFLN